MAGFYFKSFAGELPKISNRLLPVGQAQVAKNFYISSGEIKPLTEPVTEVTPTKPGIKQAIYLFADQYWFHWTEKVDCARGVIAGDVSERTYFTGQDFPRVTDNSIAVQGGDRYPVNSYRLGVPAPDAPPLVNASGELTGDISTVDTRSYVYTYVSVWGEEGPPSPPSALVDIGKGQIGEITGMAGSPNGNYNIQTKRIYRTNTGTQVNGFQFVVEVPVGTGSYNDKVPRRSLGESLPSTSWDPPADNMIGLCFMPNGIGCGFAGNELMFAEPFLPHAWPAGYRLTTDYPIVAIKPVGTSLAVVTKGTPYLVTGTDPQSMSMVKLESMQACVSKRSMVDMGNYALYASPDGLVAIGGQSTRLITEQVIDKRQWASYSPESIHAYYHDGKYIAFYDNGDKQAGFIFDPEAPQNGLIHIDLYATAGHNDLERDKLYLQIGADIKEFDAGIEPMLAVWKSGIQRTPKPVNMGAAQVIARGYPVTLKLFADGVLKHTRIVTSKEFFRMVAGYTSEYWEVQIESENIVSDVFVTETISDLRRIS